MDPSDSDDPLDDPWDDDLDFLRRRRKLKLDRPSKYKLDREMKACKDDARAMYKACQTCDADWKAAVCGPSKRLSTDACNARCAMVRRRYEDEIDSDSFLRKLTARRREAPRRRKGKKKGKKKKGKKDDDMADLLQEYLDRMDKKQDKDSKKKGKKKGKKDDDMA